MKQLAVLGLGSFGYSLAVRAYELGFDVYAIDTREDLIQSIANNVTMAVRADAGDMNTLKSIGIHNVDIVVIALSSNINASLNALINAKDLGVETVYAKAHSDQHAKVLTKLGADKVFFPEREMGERLAQDMVAGNILDIFEIDSKHTIVEISAPKSWLNKSLVELNLRARYSINIIALKTGEDVNISPDPETKIKEKDKLIVVGENDTIEKLRSKAK